jgi:hypothetical protein
MAQTDVNNVIIPIGVSIFISGLYGAIAYVRNRRRFQYLESRIEQLSSQVSSMTVQAPPPVSIPIYPNSMAAAYPVPAYPPNISVSI